MNRRDAIKLGLGAFASTAIGHLSQGMKLPSLHGQVQTSGGNWLSWRYDSNDQYEIERGELAEVREGTPTITIVWQPKKGEPQEITFEVWRYLNHRDCVEVQGYEGEHYTIHRDGTFKEAA